MSYWRWLALGIGLSLLDGACSRTPDLSTCMGPAPGSSKVCPGPPAPTHAGVTLRGGFAPGAAASPRLSGHFLYYGTVKQQQGGIVLEGRLQ